MFAINRRAARLIAATALLLVLSQAAFAEKGRIELGNELPFNVAGIYCFDAKGAETQISGALPADGAADIEAGVFQKQCRRMAVVPADGAGWQFYLDTEYASPDLVLLSLSRSGSMVGQKHPTLMIEDGGQLFIYHAGLPFFRLIQLLQYGLDEAAWREATMPVQRSDEISGRYAVAFAGTSWSLAGDGVVYKEFIPGAKLASALTIAAPFTPTRVVSMLNEFRNAGCTPWLFASPAGSRWFTVEGKELDPAAQPVGHETDARRWTDLYKMLAAVLDSEAQSVRIVMGNEEFHFELTLDLTSFEAVLEIVRNTALAFG